jgi:hypothetical protein
MVITHGEWLAAEGAGCGRLIDREPIGHHTPLRTAVPPEPLNISNVNVTLLMQCKSGDVVS